jgi:ribonucleoside-diphosphate reductase beta chain
MKAALASLDRLDVAPGLEELEMGASRITVDDKAMINCRADLNQLVPFKYQWAWTEYLEGCSNHWMPQETSMARDIELWGTTGYLSSHEEMIVIRAMSYLKETNSLRENSLTLAVYRMITNPECRQYLLRQAFEEAIHAHVHQYCVSSLDVGDRVKSYTRGSSAAKKSSWLISRTHFLSDPDSITGAPDYDSLLLINLIAYYSVSKGIFFYSGFRKIEALGAKNKMVGVAAQFANISRDEHNHYGFGVNVINQIRSENPGIWTPEFMAKATQVILEGAEIEIMCAYESIPRETVGQSLDDIVRQIQFTANLCLSEIGLKQQYVDTLSTVAPKSASKPAEAAQPQSGGALSWD